MKNVIDITQCDEIPQDPDVLAEISANAIKLDEEAYGWSALVRNMRSEVGASEELSADDNDRDTVKAAELASEIRRGVPGGAGSVLERINLTVKALRRMRRI